MDDVAATEHPRPSHVASYPVEAGALILQQISDAVIAIDRATRVTYWGPGAAALYGISVDEAIGAKLGDLYEHRWSSPEDERATHAALERHGQWRGSNVHVLRSGGERFVESTVTLLRTPTGEPDGMLAVIRDQTDRIVAERARAVAEARMAERQREIEAERSFLDEATRVLNSSLAHDETLEQVARLVVPELADWCIVDLREGERLERVALVHSDPRHLELAREFTRWSPPDAWHTGQPRMLADLDEVAGARELGFRSWIGAPLVARGQPIGVLHLLTSTSGRRYTDNDLRLATELGRRAGLAVDNARLYREARDAIRQREDILAIVSHDLRNPLGAIDLGATLLAKSVGGDPRAKKHLETVRRSAERIARMIDDLLDMASINAGKLALQPARLDAGELVTEVLDIHEPLAKERGITIVRQCELDAVGICADRVRLAQVLNNLVGNAIKFCARGDAVFVRGGRHGDRVRIAIADTGPGIPKDELAFIFQPYWSRPGRKRGTGLGLFIAKAIIEAHHGHLEVTSEIGQGTRFTLALPIA